MTPPIPDPSHVIHIIREVASREIMPRFRKLGTADVSYKRHPRDLVTIADTEAEGRLAELLQPLSPGSAVVGEEAAEADADVLALLGRAAPVWLLDPIDGTTNYACGTTCFAVIVGFCAEGETLAGWIYDPTADVVLWAAAGKGAWLERGGECHRARVAAGGQVGGMKGSLSRRAADRLFGWLAARGGGPAPEIVRYGSVGREYMDLGRGVIHFAEYKRLKPWDHAAGVLIHREAGGFSRLRSNRSSYGPRPYILEERLLLAPDETTWRDLDGMLGQSP